MIREINTLLNARLLALAVLPLLRHLAGGMLKKVLTDAIFPPAFYAFFIT
jgi:hypothetical protein